MSAVRTTLDRSLPQRGNRITCDLRKGDHPNPLQKICNQLAVFRYPAMGSGYMYLCFEHGQKHINYCEAWDGVDWVKKQPDGQQP